MKDNERKENHFNESEQPRKSINETLIPEKNAITGFTFKGTGMLLLIVIIGAIIKYFFF